MKYVYMFCICVALALIGVFTPMSAYYFVTERDMQAAGYAFLALFMLFWGYSLAKRLKDE